MDHRLIATAVGLGSFVAGAAVGYKFAEQRLAAEFEERLEKESAKMRVFYRNVPGKKFATPEEAVEELVLAEEASKALKDYTGGDNQAVAYHKVVKSEVKVDKKPEPTEEPPVLIDLPPENVFAKPERDPEHPYIISQEEFMLNDTGYEQSSLTYYEKDERVTDERDDLIDDVERVLGLDFKVNFGTDSSDPNAVHVRNERLHMDFEINLDKSSYSLEVLGVDPTPVQRPSGRS